MGQFEVMEIDEMRKRTNALHVDIRDGQLFIWGTVVKEQEVCIYPDVFSMMDPEYRGPKMTYEAKLLDGKSIIIPVHDDDGTGTLKKKLVG